MSVPARRAALWGGALAAALALAGCSQGTTPAAHTVSAANAHAVSATRGTLTAAQLDVVSGTDSVVITSGDLGDALFRVTTPADARQIPQAAGSGGVVTVSLSDVAGAGPARVDIVLSSHVGWAISLNGGASAEHVDLTGAHLKALTFAAGSSSISAALPAPSGDVPVTMAGGASSFLVQTPASAAYKVTFSGGASSATIAGVVHGGGIAAGTAFASPGWDTAANRYTITNTAGVSAFTLAAS